MRCVNLSLKVLLCVRLLRRRRRRESESFKAVGAVACCTAAFEHAVGTQHSPHRGAHPLQVILQLGITVFARVGHITMIAHSSSSRFRFPFPFAPFLSDYLGVSLTTFFHATAANDATGVLIVFAGPVLERYGFRGSFNLQRTVSRFRFISIHFVSFRCIN